MARISSFNSNMNIVSSLLNIENLSRYHALQLVEKGYIKIESIHTGKRGKPAHKYELTGKGKGLIALSKNWKKAG